MIEAKSANPIAVRVPRRPIRRWSRGLKNYCRLH